MSCCEPQCAYQEIPAPCPIHPASQPAADDLPKEETHKRVTEYDGAFWCLDCSAQWGALPGHPQEPDTCERRVCEYVHPAQRCGEVRRSTIHVQIGGHDFVERASESESSLRKIAVELLRLEEECVPMCMCNSRSHGAEWDGAMQRLREELQS